MFALKLLYSLAALFVVLVVPAEAQWGGCPNGWPTQPKFQLEKYFGKWYEIARLNFTFEKDAFCVNANYSLKADGHVKVDNEERYGSIDGKPKQAIGDAIIPDPSQPAKFAVSFGGPVRAPYWVVETDYKGFALVYSCFDLKVYHETYAWILSRTPTLHQSEVAALVLKFKSYGLDTSQLYFTPQVGCKY